MSDCHNAFELAYRALMCDDVAAKIQQVKRINALKNAGKLDYQTAFPIEKIQNPGRPEKPKLVRFQALPKRKKSNNGLIQTIHAICHIEFNAINLSLDAAYRFQTMPAKFTQDWLTIALEEAKHFTLLANYLRDIGHYYGEFDAHNGLWKMTDETDYDVLARMALVPRVLEAKGLDATPQIQKRFKNSDFEPMVAILETIFQDEIGHVKTGNYWYHALCSQRNLDPVQTFENFITQHIGAPLRGPFNLEARKLADFSAAELDFLQLANRD